MATHRRYRKIKSPSKKILERIALARRLAKHTAISQCAIFRIEAHWRADIYGYSLHFKDPLDEIRRETKRMLLRAAMRRLVEGQRMPCIIELEEARIPDEAKYVSRGYLADNVHHVWSRGIIKSWTERSAHDKGWFLNEFRRGYISYIDRGKGPESFGCGRAEVKQYGWMRSVMPFEQPVPFREMMVGDMRQLDKIFSPRGTEMLGIEESRPIPENGEVRLKTHQQRAFHAHIPPQQTKNMYLPLDTYPYAGATRTG